MRFRHLLSNLFLVGTTLLAACSGGGGDDSSDGGDGGGSGPTTRTQFQVTGTTNSNGDGTFEFDVPAGSTNFGVTIESSAEAARTNSVSVGSREYFNLLSETLGLGQLFQPGTSYVNVPSRNIDPALSAGRARVEVTLGDIRSNGDVIAAPRTGFVATVTTKADSNLSRGSLRLNVFLVGDIAQTSANRAAIDAGLARMQSIYSSQAGISLDIQLFSLGGGAILPNPFDGSNFYRSAAASAPSPAVNVFFGGDVSGLEGEVLGVAGSVPGSPTPTSRSGVVISILSSAGPDGVFDDDDIRLYGETIAHETGHFLGLFHPVDFNGTTGVTTGTDPLPDTASCSTLSQCLTNSSLIRNLMFATPVENANGTGIPQDQLTEQQRGVMNRYTAVD